MPGRVIILNGGSSTGKTSLVKALQEAFLPEPYLALGIDVFWMAMPERELDLDRVDPQYYSWVTEHKDNVPYLRIVPGPILDQMMIARYKAIAAYVQDGLNIIADDVVWKRLWLEESVRALDGIDAWFVGVYCDERVIAHREILRGDRRTGWGRGSQLYAHKDAVYDITIDTSLQSSTECAAKIKNAIEGGLKPTSAQKMREAFRLEALASK